MSGLMDGSEHSLRMADDPALFLRACNDLNHGGFQILLRDGGFAVSRGKQRTLIQKICKICAGKACGRLCNGRQIDIIRQRLFPRVNLQNLRASTPIRRADIDLPVKPSGTEQGGIENILAVRRRDDNDALVCREAVHFHEQLIERLFALVVAAAETRPALTAYRVDFVDKYNGRRDALGLIEQVAHTACADTDIELDKIRAGNGQKRNVCLTGDSSCQQCFAGARRADQQNALWDLCTQLPEFLRVAQEFHDLREFFFFFIRTGNVLEGDGFAVRDAEAGVCACKLRHGIRTAAGTVHQNEPDKQQCNADDQIGKNRPPDRISGWKVVVGLENAGCALRGNGLVKVLVEGLDVSDFGSGRACLLCAAGIQGHGQRVALQNERLDPFVFKQVEHVGIGKPAAVLRKQGRRDHHKHQRQDRDQNDRLYGFGLLIHGLSPFEKMK